MKPPNVSRETTHPQLSDPGRRMLQRIDRAGTLDIDQIAHAQLDTLAALTGAGFVDLQQRHPVTRVRLTDAGDTALRGGGQP